MFVRRSDGLGLVFLPFHIVGLALAVLLTCTGGVRGLLAVPVFIGWYLAGFVGAMVLFYLVVWLISLTVDMTAPPKEDHPFARRIVLIVISHLCRFARVRITLHGEEKLPDGRFLLVSNHRSSYDPIATVWALRSRDIGFITKPENHRIPLAGPLIFRANYLPIDRSNPREAMKTIKAATELIENDVVSVGVYPEGTRGREADMLPFHNGVFKIAQKARVPIVVLSAQGAEKISGNFPLRHTDVILDVCAVIPPEEHVSASTAEVGERVRAILEAQLCPVGASES